MRSANAPMREPSSSALGSRVGSSVSVMSFSLSWLQMTLRERLRQIEGGDARPGYRPQPVAGPRHEDAHELAGRDAARRVLADALGGALEGSGRLVLVAGEVGMGTTTPARSNP